MPVTWTSPGNSSTARPGSDGADRPDAAACRYGPASPWPPRSARGSRRLAPTASPIRLSFRWHLAVISGARRARGLAIPGPGLIAQRRLEGIGRPLELARLYLRNDLEEHHHHDTGPQRPAQRVQ